VVLAGYDHKFEVLRQFERQLTRILDSLIGHKVTLTMQINQLTPLCKLNLQIEGYKRLAMPIETSSHDYLAYNYRFINQGDMELTLPLNQLIGIENLAEGYLFYFPSYQWEINKINA
jgi:hypothetical protein